MDAIDENVEMPAQVAIWVKEVKFHRGILLDDFFDQLTDIRPRDWKLSLTVDIIFHHSRETDGCHGLIVIQQIWKRECKQKEDGFQPSSLHFYLFLTTLPSWLPFPSCELRWSVERRWSALHRSDLVAWWSSRVRPWSSGVGWCSVPFLPSGHVQ